MTSVLRRWVALMASTGMLIQPIAASAQSFSSISAQPTTLWSDAAAAPYFIDPKKDPLLSTAQMNALVRAKIKYVFIVFNENESFDHEYGTFPGANGIYSTGTAPRSAASTPGFTQSYIDKNGNTHTVQPFLIGPQQNATFADSTDHSHTGLASKLAVVSGKATMTGFAQDEYNAHASTSSASQAQGKQYANLVMAHIDCNTIPFFWLYASRFTIFDNIFATEDTPSTPNAVAMISGQSGETQWVEHGTAGTTGPIAGTINGVTYTGTGTTQGVPLVNDPQPYWGSQFDTTTVNKQPTGPKESWATTNIAPNLTYASVPLTLMGNSVKSTTSKDASPSQDLADIQKDIPFIQSKNGVPINWRWYQNGYDAEPNDSLNLPNQLNVLHESFVSHHEGPQYFGYLANNPAQRANFKGENDFFTDMANNNLPTSGGVFYIRGGYYNTKGNTPPIQNSNYPDPAGLTATEIAKINAAKSGDDDHPSYSDHQIGESLAARVINAVAGNPSLWAKSAIIITYDESDGLYDHVPPRILSYGPDGLPLSRGVRIPLILVSPYARLHTVSHAEGDHNAVIETLNAIFNLPPLSSLPNEAAALIKGEEAEFNGPNGFVQKYLGPRDTNSATTDSLLSAFSPNRLRGLAPTLPASLAFIPESTISSLPHFNGNGCSAIGITPEDTRQGIVNSIPAGFNTLPATLPAYN